MTFTKRPLVDGATLGDRLQNLRTESHLTIEDLGRKIHVTPKYLQAIEESRYRDLPGLVYARQFVRRYAEVLETDVDMALGIFEKEYAVVVKTGPASRPLLTPRVNTEFPWYRRNMNYLIAGIIIATVAAYIGVQAVRNYVPPKLDVRQPASDVSTTSMVITVSGSTDINATVTINDQSVQTSGNGTFSEQVDLHTGLNTLKISAIKKHSSARVITRQVLVETR